MTGRGGVTDEEGVLEMEADGTFETEADGATEDLGDRGVTGLVAGVAPAVAIGPTSRLKLMGGSFGLPGA